MPGVRLVEECTAVFESQFGKSEDVLEAGTFAKILLELGMDEAMVNVVRQQVSFEDGKVSWRRFVEWCANVGDVVGRTPLGLRLIASRHCTHSFDPLRPVPQKIVYDILEAVRSIPSSANTQPWTVIVTQGTARNRLSAEMLEKFDAGDDGHALYENCPKDMNERMKKAVQDYGRQFYGDHFGVEQNDMAGRRAKYRQNYEFWGAPVHLILCAPRHQCVVEGVNGIFLDMGSLLTAILLGAHAHGLGGKPQFSVAKYHDICQKVLGQVLPDDLLVVCGISIGWPTEGRDPRMQPDFFPARLSVDETTRWVSCDSSWLSTTTGVASSNGEHGLLQLIHSRHCSHSLDPRRPVPKDIISAILEAARNVPSTDNSQPWCVTVIQGKARDELSRRMLEDFDSGKDGSQTYKKYSAQNTAQMQKGKDTYGFELYEERHGLARDDKAGRRQKYRPNYEFWGAPVMLLLNLPHNAVAGTYIDVGSFMYAILLGMHAFGLGGKPLGSVAKYTDICREVLGTSAMPENEHLICGLCIGWPTDGRDPREKPDFFPSRLSAEETTRWVVDSPWSAA
eukprot:TRINITY_DN26726_c0_g1_i1.p1 TRINITY_DN26726_c0_g1~~TRINITY_DN26726_c0_g1_i1.p1  ORF type:complete len:565 (-),score=90.73 TRINITY_DN26726_c0_g1_i1:166-1860(-)